MKFGLLIQGPIISKGRTGKTVNVSARKVNNSEVVEYNCSANIDRLISNYGMIFDETVCSTWNDQYSKVFNPNVNYYLTLEDITPPLPNKKYVSNESVAVRNMFRQFYGTLEGLKKFKNVDYIIKIRSDQYFDLSILTNFVLKNNFKNENIIIPYVIRGLDFIPDFYFAGYYLTLKDFFSILVEDFKYITLSPHTNIVLMYALSKYFEKIKVGKRWYCNSGAIETNKIFNYMLNNVFYPGPRSVYENIIWRGETWSNEWKERFDNYLFETNPNLYSQKNANKDMDEFLFVQKDMFFNERIRCILYRVVNKIVQLSNRYL